jgi:hypothetical protein
MGQPIANVNGCITVAYIRCSEQFHRKVKVAASSRGETMQAFVERRLAEVLKVDTGITAGKLGEIPAKEPTYRTENLPRLSDNQITAAQQPEKDETWMQMTTGILHSGNEVAIDALKHGLRVLDKFVYLDSEEKGAEAAKEPRESPDDSDFPPPVPSVPELGIESDRKRTRGKRSDKQAS